MMSDDDRVFIGHGNGLFATTRDRKIWRANAATELIAKLDADGIDRKRLYLIVPDGPTCPDHALGDRDVAAFVELLGNEVKRGA
jgi:hypothetical protein